MIFKFTMKLLAAKLVIYRNMIISPPIKIKKRINENQEVLRINFKKQQTKKVWKIRLNKIIIGDSII